MRPYACWPRSFAATFIAIAVALETTSLASLQVEACTVIALAKGSTADGSTLVAHTDDAGGSAADVRLVHVPAMDHDVGAQRPVYNFFGGYPRLVALERGPHYLPVNDSTAGVTQELTTPMGFIPQVPHTFAYFDQDYGMMNEAQLSIGESTCGAKTVGWPLDAPGGHGKNLFGIAELTKIALERCETARCAITTIGSLAEEHGFYSEDSGQPDAPDYGDSAEGLVLADKLGEAWVFHLLTGANNSGAVWAAQRVPDGHATVLANGFTIRQLDLSRPDWFLASSNVHSVAEELGWWHPDQGKPFDFTAAYGFADKDAIGPLYTGRRVWRVFDLLAPSLKLDPRLGSFSQYETYPFSVQPDAPATLEQVMNMLRDHYDGTPFDMTRGVAAGPFGSPVRWAGSAKGVTGGWERPISMYRTLFSFVLQIRSGESWPDALGGVVWYAQDSPHGSVFVPFSCKQSKLPEVYLRGWQSKFDAQSAWWAFNFVNNWSLLRFDAINRDVRAEIAVWQQRALSLRRDLEQELQAPMQDTVALNTVETTHLLQEKSNAFAEQVVANWWKLAWTLVAKYSDGFETTGEQPDEMRTLGYPKWWLEVSDFSKWPGASFTPRKNAFADLATRGDSFIRQESSQVAGPSSGSFWMGLGLIVLGAIMGAATLALAFKQRLRADYRSLA